MDPGITNDDTNGNHIISILDGFRCSQTLFTAASFKLFDHLKDEDLSLEQLSNKLNLPYLSSLERFLNACISLKLIKQDKTSKKYSNTPSSEKYLVSTSPDTLNGYVTHNSQTSYLLWAKLPNAIRENAPQWQKTFNTMHGNEFTFDIFYRDDDAESIFMSGMHGLGLTCFPIVVKALGNLGQFKTLCDIGGATGCLAITACKANPNLEAIIFDLPQIEKHAIKYMNENSSDVRQRVRFQSGDFFVDSLPKVDLFSLGRILHDWDDEKCQILLKKIYETLPETNGAVLIIEKLLVEDKSGPVTTNMQDLNMLVATTGRERTYAEYTDLLEKTGFKSMKSIQTGAYLDAVIGYK